MSDTAGAVLADRRGDRGSGSVRQVDVRGAFDLGQSIRFGFGQREAGEDEVMRLAFVLDGYADQVGVAVRQPVPGGGLALEITGVPGAVGTADPDRAARHASRVLSVDVDARDWDALGGRDPLIGRLQAARPGLRPPLFYSAYEGAAWSVLSARRPHRQMAALRDALATECGAVVEVAGRAMPVFPTPRQLLGVSEFPGLPEIKLRRLHGVARAALDGLLDTAELRALAPEDALARLRRLDGIGPLYAQLVVIRALGHTDVLVDAEPTVLEVAGQLLGRAGPLTQAELDGLAAGWTPWRTWATVAIRAAGPLLVGGTAAAEAGAPG